MPAAPGFCGLVFTPEKLNWCPDEAPKGDLAPASPFGAFGAGDEKENPDPAAASLASVFGVPKLKPPDAEEADVSATLDPKLNPPVAALLPVLFSELLSITYSQYFRLKIYSFPKLLLIVITDVYPSNTAQSHRI